MKRFHAAPLLVLVFYCQCRYSSDGGFCTATTCEYLFTYEVDRQSDDVIMELSGKAEWLAIGFSSDQRMVN